MNSDAIIQLFVLVILLALSAFFSSAETSLTTVNKLRMRSLADEGNKNAKLVLKLTENKSKLLSTILIGNNIVNILASSIATFVATALWGNAGVGIATGILTLLILIFGEITPKSLASTHAEAISLIYAKPIFALTKIMTPLIFIVNIFSNTFLKMLGTDPNASEVPITESELRTIVDVSHEEGVIETEEREMIKNVFDFGDSMAKDIMVPRVDMTYISIDASYKEILTIYKEERYSRYPIYENSKDSVIGVLNIKDLFFHMATHKGCEFNIHPLLREPYYCYEFQKTSNLMQEMRKTSSNFTVVLDEYGTVSGIITLEDLLEEIVGEIRDEYDEGEQDAIKCVGNYEYEADGTTKLDDLNDVIGTHIKSEDYDSIGGHIIELLDHIPEELETAEEENITYTVLSLDKNRVDRVLIKLIPLPDQAEELE